MRIEDLRIGNLVSYNNCDLRVTALGSRSDIIGLERHPLTAFNRVSPIPLNEEWLLKLSYSRTTYEGYKFWISSECDFLYSLESHTLFFFNEVDGSVWNICRVRHVHKMQNIMFDYKNIDL